MREYEELIVRRDSLVKDSGIYLLLYTNKFGELIAKVFEKKIECIKKKKTIAFCQASVNRGEKIDYRQMKAVVSEEMESYYEDLKRLLDSAESAKELDVSPEFDVLKSKKIYRKIAKLLHPDVNPKTEEDEELLELWEKAVTQYHMNNYQALEEIYIRLCAMGIDDEEFVIEDLEIKKENLRIQIDRITNSEPYIYKYLLDDQDAIDEKINSLNEEYAEYETYSKQLDEVLKSFVARGVYVEWEEN